MITIADLIKYRMQNERLVKRLALAKLPTEYGDFEIIAYENVIGKETQNAVSKRAVFWLTISGRSS